MAADDFEDVDAACKRIGNSPETVSRERFAVAVLATDTLSIRTRIDRLAPLNLVMRRIGSVVHQPVQQRAQSNLRDTRHREHRAEFALGYCVVDIRQDV